MRSAQRCSVCAASVKQQQNFCSCCGASLKRSFASSTSTTPEFLTERIRNTLMVQEGERKLVTVLFADLVGSTRMVRLLDPEAAAAALDPVVAAMTNAIHAEGGFVSRIQGDGIMALFGAPIADEDHAVRACHAALRIRDTPKVGPRVRIGLHSGEVVLRVARNDLLLDYDAVGVTVHIAARLERYAAPGTICLSHTTAKLIEGVISCQPHGTVHLKGVGQLNVVELLERVEGANRWIARVAQGLSNFVGRKAEFLILRNAASTAGIGAGGSFIVTGPAGIGKSRLVHEMTTTLVGVGWQIAKAAASPEDVRAGYRPIAAMLKDWVGIDLGDDAERVTCKLIQAGGLQTAVEVVPLLALLDMPVSDTAWHSSSPARRSRMVIDAFCAFARSNAARRPLLLLFEDLQWFGDEGRELLSRLIAKTAGTPSFVLGTHRQDFTSDLDSVFQAHLALEPLDRESCIQLANGALGESADLDLVKQQIVERAQGIPLFIEEMARTLAGSSAAEGMPRHYRVADSLTAFRVPSTVQTVLAARIDRLPGTLKSLLQLASVIGDSIPRALLANASGLSERQIVPDILTLQKAEFLYDVVVDGQPCVAFKHALMRQVAYESVLVSRREAMHAAVVSTYERLYAKQLEKHLEVLGHHAVKGCLWNAAVEYLRGAADKAIRRSAFRQAVVLTEEALEALSKTQLEHSCKIEQEIQLRLSLRVALGALGSYRAWSTHLDQAERLANQTGNQGKLLAIRVSRLHLLNAFGNSKTAIEASKAAVSFAQAREASPQFVAASYFLSQAYEWYGDYQNAIKTAKEALKHVEAAPLDEQFGMTGTPAAMLTARLASSQAAIGAFETALDCGQRAWGIADSVGRDYDRCLAAYGWGTALIYSGATKKAIEVLEKGMRAAETSATEVLFALSASLLGAALLVSGAPEPALEVTERALRNKNAVGSVPCWPLFYRGVVLLSTGQPAEAERLAREAIRRARKKQHRGVLAWTHWLSGRIGINADLKSGLRKIALARRSAERLHLHPLMMQCQDDLAHALLDAETGKHVARGRTSRPLDKGPFPVCHCHQMATR